MLSRLRRIFENEPKRKLLENPNGRPKLELDKDQILLWKYGAGKSNSEIARELGVSEGTIRNRLKEIGKGK